ncbi:MAG: hypothetical protein CMI31_04085 [Opitutae bacterium]|nr:hypothetical protein [Opitutae bacterium]
MITWLQQLIEKRGKWLFVILLAVVIVSFVPYISPTGSSSLDFFTEEAQRGRDKYFGFDWYDPNDQRWLESQAAVSGALGTSPAPSEKAWNDTLRQVFSGELEQSQFQGRRVRLAMEAKIALLQVGSAWNLLPRTLGDRSLSQDDDSSRDSITEAFRAFLASRIDERSGIIENGALDSAKFEQALQNMASGLKLSTDEVQAILFEDFRAQQVDASLRSAGFALPLEGELELRQGDLLWNFEAVALDAQTFEPEPLPFASLLLEGLPENNATIKLDYENSSKTFTFLTTAPKEEGQVLIESKFNSVTANLKGTRDNLAAALKKTDLSFGLANFDVNGSTASCGLNLFLPENGVPFAMPRLSSSSAAFTITNDLENELAAYYEDRQTDEIFMKPARTGISAFDFHYSVYLKKPSTPTEAELRAYFALHSGEFAGPAKQPSETSPDLEESEQPDQVSPESDGRKGPRGRPSVRKSRVSKQDEPNEQEETPREKVEDKAEEKVDVPETKPAPKPQPVTDPISPKASPPVPAAVVPSVPPPADSNATGASDANATVVPPQPKKQLAPVTFEEVRPQVIERVLEEKRADLEAEARSLAEQRAEALVSELHALSRKLTEKGTTALTIRNDRSVGQLIDEFKPADRRMAAFSEGEIDSTSKIIGLPADALSDMMQLPGHRFFSEAAYETSKGFAVVLLDARLPSVQQDFEEVDFRVLLREFRADRKQDAFQAKGEEIAKSLREEWKAEASLADIAAKIDQGLSHHLFAEDDADSIRQSFEKRSKKLDGDVEKAQKNLDELVKITKDRNATAVEDKQINGLREEIKELREQLGEVADQRGLAEDIFAVASDADTQTGKVTGMVTGKSTKAGLFVILKEVILEIDDDEPSLVDQRAEALENSRASQTRENLLSDWIQKGRNP